MPSYSFQSSIQSIIQSIINFFEKLFGISRGQPIKTQLPPNVRPIKTIGKYHPLPSDIIKNKYTKISQPKLLVLSLPIITRHKVNIENLPKISTPKLPILPLPIITKNKGNILKNLSSINQKPISIPIIKIIPNKSLSQVLNNNTSSTNTSSTNTSSTNTLSTNTSSTNTSSTNTSSTNTSTSSTNLSQIAINPNVPLSQSLTQGRTIIPARHKNPNPKGNNGNNSSQSNNTSKLR